MKSRRWLVPWFIGVVLVTLLLSAFDGRGSFGRAVLAYGAVGLLCAVALALGWRSIAGGTSPTWLAAPILTAIALRIVVGLALVRLLPVLGYDTDPQRAGYVFWDSYKRDTDAWMISRMDRPLEGIAQARQVSDQYGGMLVLSAGTYRLVSPDAHRPLLVVEYTATASALAVLLTWAFASVMFGSRAARFAAWAMALYPEAVLLGSSQMREPFLIALFALGFYGYAIERMGLTRRGLVAMGLAIVLCLPLSPPYAAALLVTLLGAWLWEGGSGIARRWLVVGAAVALAAGALVLTIRAWAVLGDLNGPALEVLTRWWSNATDTWRMNILKDGSPIIRLLLDMFPAWAEIPVITAYGLVLPLLPAGIAEPSTVLWQAIAILRGLGWACLAPFLITAGILVLQQRRWRELQSYLGLVVLVSIVLASYRAGSLQWDNPRYRAVLLVAQATLAGWVWVQTRRGASPWLWRVAVVEAVDLLIIQWWYAGRYWGIPKIGLLAMLVGVGIATAALVLGFVIYDLVRRRAGRSLTPTVPKV